MAARSGTRLIKHSALTREGSAALYNCLPNVACVLHDYCQHEDRPACRLPLRRELHFVASSCVCVCVCVCVCNVCCEERLPESEARRVRDCTVCSCVCARCAARRRRSLVRCGPRRGHDDQYLAGCGTPSHQRRAPGTSSVAGATAALSIPRWFAEGRDG